VSRLCSMMFEGDKRTLVLSHVMKLMKCIGVSLLCVFDAAVYTFAHLVVALFFVVESFSVVCTLTFHDLLSGERP